MNWNLLIYVRIRNFAINIKGVKKMRYQVYQKAENGNFILLGRAVENIEDDEVYFAYENGEAKAFEMREFYDIFGKPFFVLVNAEKQAAYI